MQLWSTIERKCHEEAQWTNGMIRKGMSCKQRWKLRLDQNRDCMMWMSGIRKPDFYRVHVTQEWQGRVPNDCPE